MRTIPALLCPLLAAAGALPASDNLADPYVRVGVAAWYATPSITIDPDGGPEVKGSDVGLDDAHVGGMVDAYVDAPIPFIPGIHAGVWQWRDEPDAGDDVVVTGGYVVAMWELELLDRVGVALGGGAIGQSLDDGSSDGQGKSTTMPAAAVRGWVRLTDGLTAEAHVFAGAWDNDRGGDAVAQATWRLIGPLAVIGGWRQTWSTQELSDATWKITLGGPFAGAAAVF